jgi:hypothetical protein
MKYLVAIHRPNGYNHDEMLDATAHAAIDEVNDAMVAAGVRVFVGGLCATSTATSIHFQPNGELMTNEGPFLDSSEYVDGFWVLDCASQEDAIEWGRKAALACRGSVEVRPFAGTA